MKPIREIKSRDGVLHFRRWRIVETKWFNIYVHGIYMHDLDEHMHDHPWSFVSLILKGAYRESVKNKDGSISSSRRGPMSLAFRKSTAFHKVTELDRGRPVFTLVFTGPRNREWGYDVDGWWIESGRYREMKNRGGLK